MVLLSLARVSGEAAISFDGRILRALFVYVGVAGGLLCQTEIRGQHPTAREDHPGDWPRRVSVNFLISFSWRAHVGVGSAYRNANVSIRPPNTVDVLCIEYTVENSTWLATAPNVACPPPPCSCWWALQSISPVSHLHLIICGSLLLTTLWRSCV